MVQSNKNRDIEAVLNLVKTKFSKFSKLAFTLNSETNGIIYLRQFNIHLDFQILNHSWKTSFCTDMQSSTVCLYIIYNHLFIILLSLSYVNRGSWELYYILKFYCWSVIMLSLSLFSLSLSHTHPFFPSLSLSVSLYLSLSHDCNSKERSEVSLTLIQLKQKIGRFVSNGVRCRTQAICVC